MVTLENQTDANTTANQTQLGIIEGDNLGSSLVTRLRDGHERFDVDHGEKGRFHCDTPKFGLR